MYLKKVISKKYLKQKLIFCLHLSSYRYPNPDTYESEDSDPYQNVKNPFHNTASNYA
jgi:hypothetical protein